MKFKALSLAAALFLSGCAVKNIDENYSQILLDKNASQNFSINEKWWLDYNQSALNELVERALKNNVSLAKSAIAINRALAQAGVLDAALVPTFSANFNAETSRDIKSGTGTSWTRSYSPAISLSYELDLWKKLANARDAALWEAQATRHDLDATRLSVINGVVDGYFNALYLRESIALYEAALKNHLQLESITNAKFELGKEEELSLKQVRSSVLSFQNRLENAKISLIEVERTLRVLLNEQPEFNLNFGSAQLSEIKFTGVNLDVPVRAIANRPDLQAAIARIENNLLNVRVSEAEFYPSVTIGASLRGSGSTLDSSELRLLGGSVGVSLPFLNYSRLKSNLRISEADFESAKLNYISTLNEALNEIGAAYQTYEKDKILLENVATQEQNLARISEIYELKYEQGKSEMKDFLEAKNSEIDAQINTLAQRYKILQDETQIYKAMAGKFE